MPKQVKKRKRHIRKSLIVVLVIAIVAVFSAWYIPKYIEDNKLKKLGYSSETIEIIKEKNLTNTILSNQYYSKYLEQSIQDNTLNKSYISLYAAITTDRTLTDTDLLLYNRLMDKGYEEDQLQNLFNNLSFYELTPLLVFDYQWDENPYIEDCQNHKDTNSESSFSLSDSYYQLYKLQKEITNPTNINTLVNSTYGLTSDYVPNNLTDVNTQYAVTGVQLVDEVQQAFIELSTSGMQEGHYFFATTGYNSYQAQESTYNSLLSRMSESEADQVGIRAGHSEHQLGLAVNVAATYETSVAFDQTQTYQWLLEHCNEYGFIQRYPASKTSITGVEGELDHLRYVGKELAEKITASNLTYDEYYALYLAEWDEQDCIPSQKLLDKIENYQVQ